MPPSTPSTRNWPRATARCPTPVTASSARSGCRSPTRSGASRASRSPRSSSTPSPQNYGAGMRVVDFVAATEAARSAINDWVADETNDRITDLIPEGVLSEMTRLVLTNAVYLDATWASVVRQGGHLRRPLRPARRVAGDRAHHAPGARLPLRRRGRLAGGGAALCGRGSGHALRGARLRALRRGGGPAGRRPARRGAGRPGRGRGAPGPAQVRVPLQGERGRPAGRHGHAHRLRPRRRRLLGHEHRRPTCSSPTSSTRPSSRWTRRAPRRRRRPR